jgi:aspartate aminotransferase-like enzyme
MTDLPFGTFYLPGPTEVRPEILAAMMQPMIAHRGKRFESMFAAIQAGLGEIFLTARPVYVIPASGTAAMEMAMRNTVEGPVLSLVNGSFSERFADIAEGCGHPVKRLVVPAGQTFDLNMVDETLRAGKFVALTVAHSETSTGVLSDVKSIAAIARKRDVLSVVDSVSGMGGAELCADAWGIDFVLTASQKAMAIPAGLAFAVASPEYLARSAKAPHRGRYLDIAEYEKFSSIHQTPTTPALSLLYALEAQLRNITLEGIERRWGRHMAMRRATEFWVTAAVERTDVPLSILAVEGARSPTVTTIVLPPGLEPKQLLAAVAEKGYVISPGQGPLTKNTVRIGHMGDHTLDGLTRCLNAVEEALEEVG